MVTGVGTSGAGTIGSAVSNPSSGRVLRAARSRTRMGDPRRSTTKGHPMGSISQGLDLLQLGSTAFTTGSDAVDGGTTLLGTIIGAFGTIIDGAAGLIGSADLA
ncbi:MAG TPA: hypothetical protein DCR63_02185 [Microbacterium sp.]|nr:hypothetical protein [Microbacterium sp.]